MPQILSCKLKLKIFFKSIYILNSSVWPFLFSFGYSVVTALTGLSRLVSLQERKRRSGILCSKLPRMAHTVDEGKVQGFLLHREQQSSDHLLQKKKNPTMTNWILGRVSWSPVEMLHFLSSSLGQGVTFICSVCSREVAALCLWPHRRHTRRSQTCLKLGPPTLKPTINARWLRDENLLCGECHEHAGLLL